MKHKNNQIKAGEVRIEKEQAHVKAAVIVRKADGKPCSAMLSVSSMWSAAQRIGRKDGFAEYTTKPLVLTISFPMLRRLYAEMQLMEELRRNERARRRAGRKLNIAEEYL